MDAEMRIKIGAETNEAEKGINRVQNSLNKLKPASAQAGQALTNLGRVAQDLPFGFVAIQNNLNPLLESFDTLKKQSGGAKEAFKALASSLAGAGGFGIALSVASAAVTFFTNGFGAWTKGFVSGKKSVDDTSDSLFNFGDTLSKVTDEVSKSVADATKLFNALNGGTLNAGQRKKALDELKQINVEFFGSLKDEKGVIEGLQLAYDGYLKRLTAIGRAKAIESQLTKLFDKKLELELKLDPKFLAATNKDNLALIGRLQKELDKLGGPVSQQEQQNYWKIQSDGAILVNENIKKRFDLQKRIGELKAGANIIFQDAGKSNEQLKIIQLQIDALSKLQLEVANFDIVPPPPPKEKVEKAFDLGRFFLGERVKFAEDVQKLSEDTFKPFFFSVGEDSAKALVNGFNAVGLDVRQGEQQQIGINEKLQELKDNAIKTAGTITDTLTPAINSFFQSIASGSGSPFKALGEALKQLLVQLAAAVAKALIFKAILSAINPNAAAGQSFLSLFSNFAGLGSAAPGSIRTGGILGSANRIEVTGGFRLQGTTLVAALRRANNSFGI